MSIYALTANADNSSVSYILCDVDDTNAYTIPASLTQLLEPSSGQGNSIRLDRDHMSPDRSLRAGVGPVDGGAKAGELPRRVNCGGCSAQVTGRATIHRQSVISRRSTAG